MSYDVFGLEEYPLVGVFLHEKPLRIMLGLRHSGGKAYPAMLSKYADCTYSHTTKILGVLEQYNIVNYKRDGRIKYVVLTEKGEEIAFLIEQLYKKLILFSKEERNERE